MSEADWWLCGHCQSLNNLSARKCYSCRRRKPKQTVRASEYLGYVPFIDANGKVAMADIPPPIVSRRLDAASVHLPPLRDPILRDTLEVAPRPPEGARITYRSSPTPPPPPQAELLPPLPPLPPLPSGPPLPTVPAVPAGPGPLVAPGPLIAMGPGPMPVLGAQPVVAVPVSIPIPGQTERWAHWSDLLDVPKPTADRLRTTYALDREHEAAADAHTASNGKGNGNGNGTLGQRMKVARENDPDVASGSVPWPENDRPSPRPSLSRATDGSPWDPPT